MRSYRPIPINDYNIVRFWSFVSKGEPDDCWLWTGDFNHKPLGFDYGRLWISGGTFLAHRISYAISTGRDPGDMMVCHKCDIPRCVNPHHLFLGTQFDNQRDCQAKCRRKARPGSLNNLAKLSWEKVREIREILASGELSQREIAKRVGVTQANISLISQGKIWSESNDPTRLGAGK